MSEPDYADLACANTGSAGTTVCHDGVLAMIVCDATYNQPSTNSYHTLSTYWSGAGLSDDNADNTWDLSPQTYNDLATADTWLSSDPLIAVTSAANWQPVWVDDDANPASGDYNSGDTGYQLCVE